MKIVEIIGYLIVTPFYLYAIYWIFKSIFLYTTYKGMLILRSEKHLFKQWYETHPQKPVEKIELKQKICTQTQPFKVDDKTYIVCNFICDGNCQLI